LAWVLILLGDIKDERSKYVPPYPNDLAKLIHLVGIGSSRVSSAVEGLNPSYITKGFD
jgi:hypothetical protein